MASKWGVCVSTVWLVLAMPAAAVAATLQGAALNQTETALAHADLAMGAPDLNASHMHLHHVINCLVGPKSPSFDYQSEDPCLAMGNGAIVDTQGDATAQAQLHSAVSLSELGLKTTTVEASKGEAAKVAQILTALTAPPGAGAAPRAAAAPPLPAAPAMANAASVDPVVMNQIRTAIAHAGLAIGAMQLNAAHLYLHHVVNCLVGPNNPLFDHQFQDPCQAMGKGAIVDARSNATAEAALQLALSHARSGLKSTTLAASETESRQVMQALLSVGQP